MKKRVLCTMIFLVCIACGMLLVFTGCDQNSLPEKTQYQVNLFYDPVEKTVRGEETVSFANPFRALDTVLFNIYANAFREGAAYKPYSSADEARVFPNGKSYSKLDISNVTAAQQSASYALTGEDSNILAVSLPKTYGKGEKIELSFSFSLKLPNAAHRMGVSEGIVNLGNALPTLCAWDENGFLQNPYYSVGDPFISDVSDYYVSLNLPKGFCAAYTGDTLAVKEEGDRSVYEIEAKNVRDFSASFSNIYLVKQTEANGIEVRYFYYKDKDPEQSLKAAVKALELFSKAFSQYPYAKFDFAETPFYQGGMEYPGFVMISSTLDPKEYESVIVHETAHQWWYGMVGSDSVNAAWIDEGLAEFSTFYYFKKENKIEKAKTLVDSSIHSYALFREVMARLFVEVDGGMNKPLPAFANDSEYTAEVYLKGLLLHTSLYEILGEGAMLKALQTYAEKYAYERPEEKQYIDCYPKGAKSVFDAWLTGKVVIVDFAA